MAGPLRVVNNDPWWTEESVAKKDDDEWSSGDEDDLPQASSSRSRRSISPTEEADIKRALAASLQEANNGIRRAAHDEDAANAEDAEQAGPKSRNIEDCIHDLLEQPASVLPRLCATHGDTWIFIKAPPQESSQTGDAYAPILERYSTPFLASSQVLKASQSEVILKQLENPTQQFKIIRRFDVKRKMEQNGIKYVVDLTPPVEGDEAVEITENLSCPPGVLNWYYESDLYNVSDKMVAGVDEFSTGSQIQAQRSAAPGTRSATHGRPDYSPLRHRAAIERVMLSLHGEDPEFDSAPKIYTTVMTAIKHLKIPAYRLNQLTDYVVTWLRANPNCIFIELHPEITLKIADALQVPLLCQDAFSILVGEAALDMACQYNRNFTNDPGTTLHSRLREQLDETWETRIQYARNSLAERMEKRVFQDLVGDEMPWLKDLELVRNIPNAIGDPGLATYRAAYDSWLCSIKDFARHVVYYLLLGTYSNMPKIADLCFGDAKKWDSPFARDSKTHWAAFNKMGYKQRILTRTFWKTLSSPRVKRPEWRDVKAEIGPAYGFTIDKDSVNPEYIALKNAGVFREVNEREMDLKWEELLRLARLSAKAGVPIKSTNPVNNRASIPDGPRKRRRVQFGSQSSSLSLPVREPVRDNDPLSANVHVPKSGWKEWMDEPEIPPAVSPRYSNPLAPGTISPRIDDLEYGNDADAALFNFRFPQFPLNDFYSDIEWHLTLVSREMLQQPNSGSMDMRQVDTMVNMSESETKYLPLWADGMDDGSNGVFNTELPITLEEEAFGPARAGLRHTGGADGSEFGGTETTMGRSTVATSKMVNDGHSVIMDRRTVYAADEVESVRFGDSASNSGTDTTWEDVARDDVSVGTSSDLAGAMSRTQFDLSGLNPAGLSTATTLKSEDTFTLSDSDEDGDDMDDEDMERVDSEGDGDTGVDSDFEAIDFPPSLHTQDGASSKGKGKDRETSKDAVARWAKENPDEATSTIKYRERSMSPLVFEKS